jgi:hypothetical protein
MPMVLTGDGQAVGDMEDVAVTAGLAYSRVKDKTDQLHLTSFVISYQADYAEVSILYYK